MTTAGADPPLLGRGHTGKCESRYQGDTTETQKPKRALLEGQQVGVIAADTHTHIDTVCTHAQSGLL